MQAIGALVAHSLTMQFSWATASRTRRRKRRVRSASPWTKGSGSRAMSRRIGRRLPNPVSHGVAHHEDHDGKAACR